MNKYNEENRASGVCTVQIYRGWSILNGKRRPVYSWYYDFGMAGMRCIEVEIPNGMRLIPSRVGSPKLNPGDGILRNFHSMLAQGTVSPALEWQDEDMHRHWVALKVVNWDC